MKNNRRKKMSNLKKVTITFIILLIFWILGFYIYFTYQNIEVKEPIYEATRTLSTTEEQTVEKIEENSTTVADVI